MSVNEQRVLSAASVIFDGDGNVLMGLKRKYNQWEFPGGKIDPNEKIFDAGLRELKEETGIVPSMYQPLGYLDHPKWICFGHVGFSNDIPQLMEPDKHWQWCFFPPLTIREMLLEDTVTSVCEEITELWITRGKRLLGLCTH